MNDESINSLKASSLYEGSAKANMQYQQSLCTYFQPRIPYLKSKDTGNGLEAEETRALADKLMTLRNYEGNDYRRL